MAQTQPIKLGQLVEYSFTDKDDNRETDEYNKLPTEDIKRIVGPFLDYLYQKKEKVGSWKRLKESLEKGYNPKKYGYIQVIKYLRKNKYYVYDGNHRVKLLKEMYGNEHQIMVERVSRFLPILVMITVAIALPIIILKQKINGI
tara:strand:- start:327 stop:758 length:432 start_codon:yes stop_codon:yes gene_type:complete